MRKTLLFFSCSFILLSLKAEDSAGDLQMNVIGPFGTLNNFDNPMIIPSEKAQDLLNVDITPGGKSVKKRSGFGLAFALPNSGSAVHGVYDFYDSNGNNIALFMNASTCSVSVNGGAIATLFSDATSGSTLQCVDSQGSAYCVDSLRDFLRRLTATTSTTQPGSYSTGTIVAVTPDRLVMAGSLSFPNRIDFSASGDFTRWSAPFLVGSDPNQITITAPGSKITHVTYAFGRVIWFKDNSMGYIFVDNNYLSNWKAYTVSPNIGTLDNSSVYWENILYFRGQDGHYYQYDGTAVTRMSRDITGTINNSQTKRSNQFVQQTNTDFNNGSLTNLDNSQTNMLLLALSSPTQNYSCYAADFGSDPGVCSSSLRNIYRSFTVASSTGSYYISSVTVRVSDVDPTTGVTVSILSDLNQTPNQILLSSGVFIVPNSATDLTVAFSTPLALQSSTRYWIKVGRSCINDFGTFAWYYDASLCEANEYHKANEGAAVVLSGRYKLKLYGKVYYSSGTYNSAVKNAPNLATWDAFTAVKNDQCGLNSFSIRASSNSFNVNSSTPAWTAISIGQIPTIATGTYFQIQDIISTNAVCGSTTSPTLNSITQNWFEGLATDKAYGTYFNYAIWWDVQVGTGSTYNNRIVKQDLLNNGFLLYDIPSDGMYVYNNSLYFGSSTGGNIFKYGSTDDDNGAAINAYWKSKDSFGASPVVTNNPFVSGSPFAKKEIGLISTVSSSKPNTNITLTYQLNGQSSTSYSFNSFNPTSNFVINNKNIVAGQIGYFYNVQFGNNAIGQPFEVMGIVVGVRTKPWVPTP